MALHNKMSIQAAVLAATYSLPVAWVHAATSIETNIAQFSKSYPSYTLSAKAESWYNPDMGHKGWTHHSTWGFMNLKKGKPVTITVTGVSGFHPAVTVWYRKKKAGFASVNYVDDHFYNEYSDIINTNAQLTDDPAKPVKLGKIKMEYVANAFDRDGMSDPLPAQFDQSMLNRSLDGEPGKVSLTFTPELSGVYQFVVGGINPDPGLSLTDRHQVEVSVSFTD